MLHGESDLGNVVFNEELCPSIRAVEESWRCDVAQVADQTRSEDVNKRDYVVVLPCPDDCFEAAMDETVIIVFAGGILAPEQTYNDQLRSKR